MLVCPGGLWTVPNAEAILARNEFVRQRKSPVNAFAPFASTFGPQQTERPICASKSKRRLALNETVW